MRVLGIETSSRRGTIALVEEGRVVVARESGEAMHGERVLPLLDELFSSAGWAKNSLDRVGVGVGPGSFTGVRIGVALGLGVGLGLGRPVIGVGSLRAMCRGTPQGTPGPRCALLDARRGELFMALYDAEGAELAAPRTVSRTEIEGSLGRMSAPPVVVVGEVLAELGSGLPGFRSEMTDLPHAVSVALAAVELSEALAPPEPVYVRPADAIRPNLPRSPLSSTEPR